jgi:hypothetical protein
MDEQNDLLKDVTQDDFLYIHHYHKRPKGMEFKKYKDILHAINKLDQHRRGRLAFHSKDYKQKTMGQTFKK